MGLLFRPRRPLLRLATGSSRSGGVDASEGQPAAQLERLSRLHASGGLTDDEYRAAKTKVLGT